MSSNTRRLRGLAAAAALAVAGCGGASTANVGGVVTLDGAPLDGAAVTFSPVGASDIGSSTGRTDAQGRYAMRTVVGDRPGAAVGAQRVTISLYKPNPKNQDAAGQELVPARYNQNSDLKFDVPTGGTDAANFDLKTK